MNSDSFIDEILFSISKETLQQEAKEKIGRLLTEDEILNAKKGLEYGLLTGIDIVYDTIFSDIKNLKICP